MEIEERLLILPCDPEFAETTGQRLPPSWRAVAEKIGENPTFVVCPHSGLMRPATPQEVDEYICGGEYEERLRSIGEVDDGGDMA